MGRFAFEIKYFQKLEYGQKNISVKTLHRLAKAFGVPVLELFRFE
jgi:transcriptional regulator with XRE-family HTH domain